MSFRVLVADDSGTMRKIIVRCLNSLGFNDVTEAGNGDEAIHLAHQSHFDLVLTDWNMPGKSGLDVVQFIRAGGSTVPVIMVTTESERRQVLAAITAGVTDYLVKPFTADALKAKLEKVLTPCG